MTPKVDVSSEPVDRRRFLQVGTLGMAALAEGAGHPRAAVAKTTDDAQIPAADMLPWNLIDVNVSVSHWPFRRLALGPDARAGSGAPIVPDRPGLGRQLRRAAAPRRCGREPPVDGGVQPGR